MHWEIAVQSHGTERVKKTTNEVISIEKVQTRDETSENASNISIGKVQTRHETSEDANSPSNLESEHDNEEYYDLKR